MTTDAIEDVEKGEHSSIVGGFVSLYNHSGNQSGGSSENWTDSFRMTLDRYVHHGLGMALRNHYVDSGY